MIFTVFHLLFHPNILKQNKYMTQSSEMQDKDLFDHILLTWSLTICYVVVSTTRNTKVIYGENSYQDQY